MPRDHRSESDELDEALNDAALDDALAQSADENLSFEAQLINAERRVLMAQAELDNFRKRTKKDTEQQLKYANLPLVRDLLDVVDNLQRAITAASADQNQRVDSGNQALAEGVRMVLHQFLATLTKYGCQPIQALGCHFDPNFHDAIAQMPSNEYDAGTVAQEIAVGYLLHDRVVRPSSVIVSSGPQ